MPPSRVRIPPSPLRSTERCPSGLRSATGNRVRAERCVAGSNPALSALVWGNQRFPHGPTTDFSRHCLRVRPQDSGRTAPGRSCHVTGYARLMDGPVNIWDYERLAEEKLDANALAYFAGGSGDEITLRDNLAAFERRKLRPRVLVDVSSISTATTVLGTDVALPILIAPLALQRMAHPDGELATARAAAAGGTIMCLSTAATARPAEVAAVAPGAPRWFQVYVFADRSETEALVAEAVANEFSGLVLTVDTPHLGRRERDIRVDFRIPEHLTVTGDIFGGHFDTGLTWHDLEWLARYGVPVVVKGILPPQESPLACEPGAAAVPVSNHRGPPLARV